ncbi:FixH family protein [Streptomyces sp. NPDC056154]|uniref:FixH family protein n=1 Tax=Streptomyces sp. NPDC056154 TaxID=3345729 RepID=UPI0035D762A8
MSHVKRSMLLLIAALGLLISAACSSTGGGEAKESEKLQVEVHPVQTVLVSGRAILIDAHVSQGNDALRDGAQVQFEIWKKDGGKHDMITAIPVQDGNYRVQTLFPDGGEYSVVAHVKHNGTTLTTNEQQLVVQQDVMG